MQTECSNVSIPVDLARTRNDSTEFKHDAAEISGTHESKGSEPSSFSIVQDLVMQILLEEERFLAKSTPSKEVQDLIQQVVRQYIRSNRPIPILIASAPCKLWKTDVECSAVDLAEVEFLKILKVLCDKVQLIYKPGVDIVIRLEDATGILSFWKDSPEALHKRCQNYAESFKALVSLMKMDEYTSFVKETELMDFEAYQAFSLEIKTTVKQYLEQRDSDDVKGVVSEEQLTLLQKVNELGWKGDLAREARMQKHQQYKAMGIGSVLRDLDEHYASFIGCVVARRQLKGSGEKAGWEYGKIDISLVPLMEGSLPVPRLHFRSVPFNVSKCSKPFWDLGTFAELKKNKQVVWKVDTSSKIDIHKHKLHIIHYEEYQIDIAVWSSHDLSLI
jgi:hypothetical protein